MLHTALPHVLQGAFASFCDFSGPRCLPAGKNHAPAGALARLIAFASVVNWELALRFARGSGSVSAEMNCEGRKIIRQILTCYDPADKLSPCVFHSHSVCGQGGDIHVRNRKTGGKQCKVAPGDKLNVEKLDAEVGAKVELEAICVVDGGKKVEADPAKAAATKVVAIVLEQFKGEKQLVFKFKKRKNKNSPAAARSSPAAKLTQPRDRVRGLGREEEGGQEARREEGPEGRRSPRPSTPNKQGREPPWLTRKVSVPPVTAAIPRAASRREVVRRPGGQDGQRHRSPARHAHPSGRERRPRQGRHAVRPVRRHAGVHARRAKRKVHVRPEA